MLYSATIITKQKTGRTSSSYNGEFLFQLWSDPSVSYLEVVHRWRSPEILLFSVEKPISCPKHRSLMAAQFKGHSNVSISIPNSMRKGFDVLANYGVTGGNYK